MRLGLRSLESRMVMLLGFAGLTGALIYAGVTQWPLPQILVWMRHDLGIDLGAPARFGFYGGILVSLAFLLPLSLWLGHRVMSPITKLLRALEGAVASYRDGDFSFSIAAFA